MSCFTHYTGATLGASPVTQMNLVTRMNELFSHRNESCHEYEWVMSHIRISHVTHTNESCHAYEWVLSQIWMSLVIHINESYHTYEWAVSHVWMSPVARMNESCRKFKWALSRKWKSQSLKNMSRKAHGFRNCFTRIYESRHTYE